MANGLNLKNLKIIFINVCKSNNFVYLHKLSRSYNGLYYRFFVSFKRLFYKMLNELYKYHKELIKMASVFSKQDAEDIVQETYIKMHLYSSYDKCFTNDILNKSYVFICIRSVFLRQFLKKDNYESFYNEGDVDEEYLIVDEFNEEEEIDWYKFRTKCEAEVNSWDAYDKKLFTIYRDSGLSMQELANETKISKTSIFHSLKEHKRKLKDLFQNDYNNLK